MRHVRPNMHLPSITGLVTDRAVLSAGWKGNRSGHLVTAGGAGHQSTEIYVGIPAEKLKLPRTI